jgi:hypothetical protein
MEGMHRRYIGTACLSPKVENGCSLVAAPWRVRELPMNTSVTAGSRSRVHIGRTPWDMEESMPRTLSVLLGICVAAALLAPVGASAATLPAASAKIAEGTSAIEKTQYRRHNHHWRHHHPHRWHRYNYDRPAGYGRCRAWRHECVSRWGWGGHGYSRCLWRHGC